MWALWPVPRLRVGVELHKVAASTATVWLESTELGTMQLSSNPAEIPLKPWQRAPHRVTLAIRRPGYVTRRLRSVPVRAGEDGLLALGREKSPPAPRSAPSPSPQMPASSLALPVDAGEFQALVVSTRTQINRLPLPELRRRHDLMRASAARFKAAGDSARRAEAANWAALLADMIRHRERHQHVRLLGPELPLELPSLLGPAQPGAEPEQEDEMPLL